MTLLINPDQNFITSFLSWLTASQLIILDFVGCFPMHGILICFKHIHADIFSIHDPSLKRRRISLQLGIGKDPSDEIEKILI